MEKANAWKVGGFPEVLGGEIYKIVIKTSPNAGCTGIGGGEGCWVFKRISFFIIAALGVSFLPGQAAPLPPEVREMVCQYFNHKGPGPGMAAPDFTLKRPGKGTPVRASELWAKKPLVMITGSYSCPWFRQNTPVRRALIRDFGDRVNFVVVYTLEAHPSDAASPYSEMPFAPEENREEGIAVPQAKTYAERATQAESCAGTLEVSPHLVVDGMDNTVWKAFGESPNCAYLIGRDGKVVAQQGLSNPVAMRGELEKLLAR